MEKKKRGRPRKPFPLPPRRGEGEAKPGSSTAVGRVGAVAKRGVRAVAGAPGKLLQRVNEELYKRNAELAVRNKTLALLRKLDEISLATVEMDDMATQMTAAIATELGYDLVSLALVDKEAEEIQWLALASAVPDIAASIKPVSPESLRVPLQDGLVESVVLREQKEQFSENLEKVFPAALVKALGTEKTGPSPHLHSMVYPLRFGRQTLGLLTISASRSLKDASRYEHESLAGIVGLVSLAMYKADLYEDLQETSAKLEQANEQLTELDKAKSEFLSIASHQLYTPLTALRGYLSMMLEGDFGEITTKQQPVFDILSTSTERLITLIKNLLDISRIESGRLELNLQSVDLVNMTDEMVQQLYPNAVAKGLKLAFHHPPADTPHVIADEQRIRQVMLNFIDNSIKYTAKGSIDVKIAKNDDEVIYSVTDTGKGLTADDIAQLFHKFSRVGGASRFHTEGTGLGLYVAKQIVNEHHGDVEVASPGTGKGSTFSMRLPAEGSAKSLKLGDKASVVIKAADARGEGPTKQM